jgi:hypothetical protein
MEFEIEKAKVFYNVNVTKENYSCKCGNEYYKVVNASNNKTLGVLEFGHSHGAEPYTPGKLIEKVQNLLRTPREVLEEIVDAESVLYDDIKEFRKLTGIHCYVPNALPVHKRTRNNKEQGLYTTTELYFDNGWYSSSESFGIVWVGLTEHVPGKEEYSSDEIYKKGDLIRAFLKDEELIKSYKKAVDLNSKNQKKESVKYSDKDWTEMNNNITTILSTLQNLN